MSDKPQTADMKDVLGSAQYLVRRTDKMTVALYALSSLLEGKTGLDETQVSGLSLILEAMAFDLTNEINEHGDDLAAIETMLAA
jgi:hypothetical protein